MKLSISLSIALIVLILDLASKYWVESALEFGQSIPLTSFFSTCERTVRIWVQRCCNDWISD